MPKIDIARAPTLVGSKYPSPYDEPCRTRENRRLGDAAGLTQFGVMLTRLPPGAWSSQRHWHATEDEFVYVLSGEVWLVTDVGEELLRSGECAGFKAGVRDGHHFQNRSTSDAVLLAVGTRDDRDSVVYPDIDLLLKPDHYSSIAGRFAHKDGTLY